MVECETVNFDVPGSSPGLGAIFRARNAPLEGEQYPDRNAADYSYVCRGVTL